MTITEAVKAVLKESGEPLSHKEIHDAIVVKGLYVFKAKDPESIVRSTIRRHCEGVDSPMVRTATHFVVASKEGRVVKYALKG